MPLDTFFYEKVSQIHSNSLNVFFETITSLGMWQLVLFFIIFFSAYFYKRSEYKWIVAMYLSFGLSFFSTLLIKFIVLRPRPINQLLIENNFSFPSGHATVAAVFYTFIFYYFYTRATRKISKFFIMLFASILVLLIGFSRLYLQVHYLSDVVVGFTIGLLGFLIARKILKV